MAELKRAGVRLTAEGAAQYKADLKSATAALKQMAAESKRNIAALGQGASASKRYGTAIKDLGNTAKLAQAKLDVLHDRQKQLANSSRQYAASIGKLESQLKDAKGDTTQLSNALADLRSKESLNNAELSRLNATIARTETQMLNAKNAAAQMANEYRNAGGRFADVAEKANKIGTNFDNAGNKAMNFGRNMTSHVTTPIVAGLGYAANAYMKFDNQMNQMKVQLDDGSVSAGKLKQQVEQLGTSSQNMAKQYGIAGESIRNGMNELIKKGFTFNQVTGAMPSILKATVASGDDFQTVMSVSSNVLEQFGLKVNDTNQMLKNTDRVTSVLTFTANKTSAGFADLGEAMQNVGPMAANNNQSLEDMASTLGVLANRGIEGGEAGTYLMNALQNLATPTKEQAKGLKDLGVSAFDATGKMKPFPNILEEIEKATKGMTEEQKNAALSTIFNTQAMKGINPLIKAGSKSIKDLSASTKDASKYQDELAKKMGQSASQNVAKMRESFKVLAETLGAHVVPAIIPLIDKATQLANKFGSLDSKTKQSIVNLALFAAAIGPIAMGVGGLLKVIGGASTGFGKLAQFMGKYTTSAGKVVSGSAKAAEGVSKFGSITQKVSSLAPMLSNPYVLAFGAIALASAGVGIAVYQNLHKDDNAHKAAVESTKGKYQEWFDSVTRGAKDAAGSQTEIQNATKKSGQTYKQMTDEMKKANTELQDNINKTWDGYEEKVGKTSMGIGAMSKDVTRHVKGMGEELKHLGTFSKQEISGMENTYKNYATMVGASFNKVSSTIQKHQVVERDLARATIDATKQVTTQVVDSLNKQKQAKLDALKHDQEIGTMTEAEYKKESASITREFDGRINAIQNSQSKIQQIMSTAARERRALTSQETADIVKSYATLAQESGKSISTNQKAMEFFGNNLQAMLSKSGQAALKQAGILDSSAQKQLKNAKNNEEAINIILKAIDRYNGKETKEKKLKAKDETTKEAKKASKSIDEHNSKKVKDKELKAKDKTTPEAKKADKSIDEHNAKKAKDKDLKANDKTTPEANKAKKAVDDYNKIKAQLKELKAKDEASEKALKAKLKVQELNNTKAQEKILKARDEISALAKKVKDALKQVDALKVQVKELKAKDEASQKAQEAKGKLDNFNSTKMSTKDLHAQGNASPFTDTAQGKLDHYNGTGIPLKTLSANGNTSPFTDTAQGKVDRYNGTGIPLKTLSANGNATPFSNEARGAVNRYNGTGIPTKKINVNSNAPSVAQEAINALNSIPKSITSTIRVIKEFITGHATGGHIDAYAEGGNIMSHSVPGTYTGIVGEAGPEIFSVSRGNVTITPLNSREKMKGLEGVLAEHGAKNKGDGIVVNINLNDTVIKEEADEDRLIRKMDRHLRQSLAETQMIGGA